tara:strand:+ start:473 stop:1297 length:825 start_codon:yes stop_codon:yes gene_type:complete
LKNLDEKVIHEFGKEWTRFDYSKLDKATLKKNFDQYFDIFPWHRLTKDAVGFDMGCGTGRWAQFVAPKVDTLNCIEPSDAIEVAKNNLLGLGNVKFYKQTTQSCSLEESSQDFGYSLGVLHHIPDTQAAIKDCAKLLKSGAPLLLYLYYDFENKPFWYKIIWRISDFFRRGISRAPNPIKYFLCTLIATCIYLPFSRFAYLCERLGFNVENMPLSDYRAKPFYQSQNDALDRFGTRLEKRFSKAEIEQMLDNAECKNIQFSNQPPFWCCVALKK